NYIIKFYFLSYRYIMSNEVIMMKLDKLDKIVLTYNDYAEISKWVRSQEFDSVDITLNEGFITMTDIEHRGYNVNMGIYFKIDISTGDLTVQQYEMDTMDTMELLITAK